MRHILSIIACVLLLFSCKKEDSSNRDGENESPSPATGSRMELTLDSIFLYAKQVYLWHDALPDYQTFAPRQRYSTIKPEFYGYTAALFDLSQRKLNPAGFPYEQPVISGKPKYSYLTEIGSTAEVLAKANHIANPESTGEPLFWNTADKRIAYLYVPAFPDLATVSNTWNTAFMQLAAAKTSDLIVDLRNNAGGYVQTAKYMANLIAPDALEGKRMFTEVFNTLLQSNKAAILKKQLYRNAAGNTVPYQGRLATMADVDYSAKANAHYFQKNGGPNNVQRLYFIVSNQTASASELLIHIFRPYLPVTLIGQQTFGKPVGFFPIKIDNYALYLSSFVLENAQGKADYFNGMPPDIELANLPKSVTFSVMDPAIAAALTAIGYPLKNSSNAGQRNAAVKSDAAQVAPIPLLKTQFTLLPAVVALD
ncbi:S41 family peptidase [Sphingobacterium sp. Mn56C]|uniref:S41 family peptidase n=1 Tax=Sphingobacterium sp. Mn56C TaxID=3395261 RepID=UPI003BEAF0EB